MRSIITHPNYHFFKIKFPFGFLIFCAFFNNLQEFKIIKKSLLLIGCSLFFSLCYAQQLYTDNLIAAINLPAPKLNSYLIKNGFKPGGESFFGDTILNEFYCKPILTTPATDSIARNFCRKQLNTTEIFIYQTNCLPEFIELVNGFKAKGFFCNALSAGVSFEPTIFQFQNVRLTTFCSDKDGLKIYNLRLEKDKLPQAKNINFSDDLLAFTSEECLQFYFGKENVISDNYYYFNKEIAKCSVLFINTQRQVVFIWQDQINKCTIKQLLFGGQQRLESSRDHNNFIAENKWRSKSGLQPGMPLVMLRKLNGDDFKFQSGGNPYFGTVMPDSTGKINFKKEHVILGCMNCNDEKFLSSSIVSADDALADSKILFVLSVVLDPL